MSPILTGIIASGISGNLTPPVSPSFDSIATVIPSGSTNVVSFTSIPSTYKHLQLRLFQKDNYASQLNASTIRFNSDAGSNYTSHRMMGDGGSASSDAYTNQTGFGEIYASANNSSFGATVMDVLDYTDTNKYKTVRMLTGMDANGSGRIHLNSALWQSSATITSISFTIGGSGINWNANSHFALYGIKG